MVPGPDDYEAALLPDEVPARPDPYVVFGGMLLLAMLGIVAIGAVSGRYNAPPPRPQLMTARECEIACKGDVARYGRDWEARTDFCECGTRVVECGPLKVAP